MDKSRLLLEGRERGDGGGEAQGGQAERGLGSFSGTGEWQVPLPRLPLLKKGRRNYMCSRTLGRANGMSFTNNKAGRM